MRWLWIDAIAEFKPGVSITTTRAVPEHDEVLANHFSGGSGRPATPIMPACLIIEGCAQSGGILIGQASQFRERVILAKISRAAFERDARPGETLRYHTQITNAGDTGVATSSEITIRPRGCSAFVPAGSVSLVFSILDRAVPGLDLPEGNFVFGQAFRDLLARSSFPML